MRRKELRKIFSVLLVALFASYWASITLFSHTHTYDWGRITHSHPYLPTAAHSHTTLALNTIDSLSNLIFLVAAVVASPFLLKCAVFRDDPSQERIITFYIPLSSLRAPPVSLTRH